MVGDFYECVVSTRIVGGLRRAVLVERDAGEGCAAHPVAGGLQPLARRVSLTAGPRRPFTEIWVSVSLEGGVKVPDARQEL